MIECSVISNQINSSSIIADKQPSIYSVPDTSRSVIIASTGENSYSQINIARNNLRGKLTLI